jgi:hypothetical protein
MLAKPYNIQNRIVTLFTYYGILSKNKGLHYAGNGTTDVRRDDENCFIFLKQYRSLRKFQRNPNPAEFCRRLKSTNVMAAMLALLNLNE